MTPNIQVRDCELYYIPVSMSSPLRFGRATVRSLDCLRVRLTVEADDGRVFHGWGETPLNIGWAWPEAQDNHRSQTIIRRFCSEIAASWRNFNERGHALELGYRFLNTELARLWHSFRESPVAEGLPRRAAFLCAAPFDIALHDAYGLASSLPTYATYGSNMLNHDLSTYFETGEGRFKNKYPSDYFSQSVPTRLDVWHLVGCGDQVTSGEEHLQRSEPRAQPRSLRDWIQRDGVTRFKIKMCGCSWEWDYRRVLEVGAIAEESRAPVLSLDFNGTAPNSSYVTSLLTKLSQDAHTTYDRISYVEQPFSPETTTDPGDVRNISAFKPVFVDEGAIDWRETREAYAAGYGGVALKTCKTQTSAILSACWAREHGMELVVQDLTNPMLAQIPHLLLAAHVSPHMGVESNSMQFCPDASAVEAKVHPNLYNRQDGKLDLSTIDGPGFGYRIEEICRELPDRVA